MSNAAFFDTVDTTGGASFPGANPLAAIWRRKMLFAIVFACVFGCAMLALVLLPVRYLASGSIILAEQETGLAYPPAGWVQKVGDPADLESQLLLIRSPRVLRLVTQSPGVVDMVEAECNRAFRIPYLMRNSCGDLTADTPEMLDYLLSHYSFIGAGRSRVISIGYSSSDPDTAKDMANALINVFLEDHRRGLTSSRAIAASGIREEMVRLDDEIRKADIAIQDYRQRKGLMSGATASFTSERLTSISQQLATAEALRDQAAAILATAKTGGSVAALPAVLESRAVADIKQRLSSAAEQAEAAAVVLGPRHPRLRSLQGQVQTLQRSLSAEIRIVVASAQKQFDAANDTARTLRGQMEAAKADVSVAAIDENAIEQMVRDAAVKRQQYAELYEKRKTLESEERAVLGSTRLVSLAERPLKKFFPKTVPFVAGGAALALMAGVGSALLRDRWRSAAPKLPVEAPEQQNIPVLARFPQVGGGNGRRGFAADLAALDTDAEAQLALGALLAGVITAGRRSKSRSVLVLSAFPRQGRTFTAMALGRFAAQAGNHVLVVECDMRNPTLETALALKPEGYVQDVLEGIIDAPMAVLPTDVARLDVIVSRRIDGDPTELLAGRAMTELVAWSKIYDLVIFDSPALDRQMDGGLLTARVDGVLLCAGKDDAEPQAVAMVARRLTNLGANIFGIVHTARRLEDRIREKSRSMLSGTGRG